MGKVRTHISIESEQKDWIEDKNINLSGFVRDAIDEARDEL